MPKKLRFVNAVDAVLTGVPSVLLTFMFTLDAVVLKAQTKPVVAAKLGAEAVTVFMLQLYKLLAKLIIAAEVGAVLLNAPMMRLVVNESWKSLT